MSDIPENSPVIIGEITGVYGVKGWVKVFSHTQPRQNIINYNPWLLDYRLHSATEWRSIELIQGRNQGKTVVAQLKNVTNRDEAQALIGKKIAIQPSQLEALPEGEFYWLDLEGLQVVNLQGENLGVVSHLIETGANDVMVVNLSTEYRKLKLQKLAADKQKSNSKQIMIPYLMDSVIKKVDLENKQIEVDWDDEYF